MSSHHHHPTYPTPNPTCCHCFYTPSHHHPPPPPPDIHLHHYHYPPPQLHPPYINQHHPLEKCHFQEERQNNPTISSLLRRISALESTLLRRSSSSHSIRDAAARTIQTHFRAFLLRRSRTLRQLKELASIKSRLGILKSEVSENTHFSYYVIYHKALTLLLKLDTIQGGDPMIRDGKKSIIKELNNFLDLIDGFCEKRRGHSRGANVRYETNSVKSRDSNRERKTGNLKLGGLKRVNEEKMKGLVERINKLAEELDDEEIEVIDCPSKRNHKVPGNRTEDLVKQHGSTIRPKVKKSVSFAENMVDAREIEDDLCRAVEEIGVSSKEAEDDEEDEDQSENGSSLSESDGEKDLRSNPRSEGNFVTRHNESRTENFVFSAPLPVKMETRAELIDKRKKMAQ
ncbi:hypothetical protein ACJIZ3_014714 [Penstemon smallii]|uniref:BAG domain-containing protein n=1 Tax=Penstemon smallii TaxID=265156 RepID=A0ABD3RS02_9LAMI